MNVHALYHFLFTFGIQSSTNRRAPGLVNFVPALAYYFCLNLPAAFTQPGARLLVEPCTCDSFSVESIDIINHIQRISSDITSACSSLETPFNEIQFDSRGHSGGNGQQSRQGDSRFPRGSVSLQPGSLW